MSRAAGCATPCIRSSGAPPPCWTSLCRSHPHLVLPTTISNVRRLALLGRHGPVRPPKNGLDSGTDTWYRLSPHYFLRVCRACTANGKEASYRDRAGWVSDGTTREQRLMRLAQQLPKDVRRQLEHIAHPVGENPVTALAGGQ